MTFVCLSILYLILSAYFCAGFLFVFYLFTKSLPKGNLEDRGGCIFRYIPTRGSVRTFSHPRQGGIRFNTVRLHCLGVVVGVVGLMGEVEVVRGKLKGNLEGEG